MEPSSNPNSKALVVFNPEISVSRAKSEKIAKDPTQKSLRRSTRTSSRLAASAKSPKSNPNPANQSPNQMSKRPRESDAPQFSEIRSKRRHQAFSQQPYHPDFIDANSKKRFDELFATKEFLVEQPFTIDSHSVFEILQLNQLDNCVSFGGNYNKSAVAEFYANIGPAVTDTKSPTYQKVFVRGVWVNFSPTDINQLLGSPIELSDFSPELERPNISPDEMVQTLTKNKFQVWPENTSLFPASHLSTQFALLHKLSKSQWIPSSRLSDISQREAMFLYLLASKTENLNIGCVIYENILERANPNKQRKLVHPVLITKLLKQQSVPFRTSDVVLDVPAPLGSNKRLHTGNRVNDLPSSSAPRAETRQFYPAHLTAELRAAVSDAQKCLLRLSSILDEVSKHVFVSHEQEDTEVEDKEDSVCSLTSEQEVTEVEEDKEDSVCSLTSKDTDTCSKSERASAIRQTRNKGKSKVEVVEDSDDKEDDSVYSRNSEDTETYTCSEFEVAKTIPKRRNKGKNNPVKPKVANLKKQEAAKKWRRVEAKIKNPQRYLHDPNNLYFETAVKNRIYELIVPAQLVKDECLRFGEYVNYIDGKEEIKAEIAKCKSRSRRVFINKWEVICRRNKLKKEDRVLCELLRNQDSVHAIKVHIIRGSDL